MSTKNKIKTKAWLVVEATALGALMPLFVHLLITSMFTIAIAVLYLAMVLLVGCTLYKVKRLQEDINLVFFKLIVELALFAFVTAITTYAGGNLFISVGALVGAVMLCVGAGLIALRNLLN